MKLSMREKWMAALVPAIITGLIYQRFYQSPAQTDIEGLQKQIQSQGPLTARVAASRDAEAEHGRLERLLAAKRKPETSGRASFNRTAALQQISKLCETGGLTLLSSSPQATAKLPPSIEQVQGILVRPDEPFPPQVWRLELQSSYTGMIDLLDGIARAPLLVIPLNVGMQPDPDETRPLVWTLTVWM